MNSFLDPLLAVRMVCRYASSSLLRRRDVPSSGWLLRVMDACVTGCSHDNTCRERGRRGEGGGRSLIES